MPRKKKMQTVLNRTFLFSSFFLCCSLLFAGGSWTSGKKKGFFQVQSTIPIGTYNKLFHFEGKDKTIYLNRNVLDFTALTYFEYGLFDKLDIYCTIPFKFVSTSAGMSEVAFKSFATFLKEGNLSGFSNLQLNFKYQLTNKSIISAITLKTSLNNAVHDLEKGLSTGYSSNAIGGGIFIGKSFNEKLYAFIESYFLKRDNNFSDEYDINLEIGYKIKPKLWLMFVLDNKKSVFNGAYFNINLEQTGLYTNNQEFFAYGLKGAYSLSKKSGINFSTFGALSGNRVAHLATLNLGWFKKF
jgi:hypothetical protein